MANIMITEACNLNCPYCFADEFTNAEGKPVKKMSLENFDKAVNFALTQEGERIGIIGGEPTLHPNFKQIIERLIHDNRVRNFIVFTNGLHLDRYYNLFASDKASLLINCNSPADIGNARFEKLVKNIDYLINSLYKKDKISLGINMYKIDFDYKYIIELLKRYNIHKVRTSIVVPDKSKQIDVIDYFENMKPRVFEFFKELEKNEIMPTYDCNLMPTCITSKEEKQWLSDTFWKMEAKANHYCNIVDDSKCWPVIDILPDLNAVRCFGLSKEWKVSINNFNNIQELRDYYFNIFDVFAYTVSNNEKCQSCSERQKMKCSGGCLLFKADKIKQAREYCQDL